MQANNISASNRVRLDQLEPLSPQRPMAPPAPPPEGRAAPAQAPSLAQGPASAFARDLDESFRSLRTRLDEAPLGGGFSFRPPALEVRTDVLRIQPIEMSGPSPQQAAQSRPLPPGGMDDVRLQPPAGAVSGAVPAGPEAFRIQPEGTEGSQPAPSRDEAVRLQPPADRFGQMPPSREALFRIQPLEEEPAEEREAPSVNRTQRPMSEGLAGPAPGARSMTGQQDGEVAPEDEPGGAATPRPAQLEDAPLGTLAGATSVQAPGGRFQLDVNGQTLTFRAEQPLGDLVSRLSGPGTGAQASLDPRGQLAVRSTGAEELSITDRRGNLAGGLGIEVTPSENTNAALTRDLQDFASGLSRAINLIETEIGQGAESELQGVLRDLEGALNSLFTPSIDGSLQSLGDLGFRREGGEVVVDQARLQALVSARPDEVNRVVGAVGDNAQPILQSGERVAQTLDTALPEARRAGQDARVRAEVVRLQVRQQTLTLDRVAAEGLRQRVARQSEALGRIAESLAAQVPSGLPSPSEEALQFTRTLPETRPRPRPVSSYRLPVPNAARGGIVGPGT
ncbi:MAG: hypothetical protein VKS61_06080 [Candidatus Sericytochromatia bacterium]|nr:hypothetical protein [Candidatus Sericytochromatia bacterium]